MKNRRIISFMFLALALIALLSAPIIQANANENDALRAALAGLPAPPEGKTHAEHGIDLFKAKKDNLAFLYLITHYYRTQQNRRDVDAIYTIGIIFRDGLVSDWGANNRPDKDSAIEFFREAAARNHGMAQLSLANLLKSKSDDKSKIEAAKAFADAAHNGIVDAYIPAAEILLKGRYLVQNFKRAAGYLRKAALSGDSEAQEDLAGLYLHGFGVRKDLSKAYMWLLIANVNGESTKSKRSDILDQATTDEINTAQQMAEDCFYSQYKRCPE